MGKEEAEEGKCALFKHIGEGTKEEREEGTNRYTDKTDRNTVKYEKEYKVNNKKKEQTQDKLVLD